MRIAVTVGDAAGIGPEVALRSLAVASAPVILVGPANAVRESARRLGVPLEAHEILDTGDLPLELLCSGRNDAATGRASHRAVETAVRLVLEGRASALVTAPISKAAWGLAGIHDPGHTEFIGRLAGGTPVMGFAGVEENGRPLRLALATIHEPIARVPSLLSVASLLEVIRIAHRDLVARFRIASPRIGVAGLNPHAGENGRIGTEEQTVIGPAIRAAREEGIGAEGPLPGDALFLPRMRGRFDLVVAQYHDQGLAPFKALTSGSGVNVTLGLSVIRTSPDHGTAFDIAGRSQADPSSMGAAIRLAEQLASGRA